MNQPSWSELTPYREPVPHQSVKEVLTGVVERDLALHFEKKGMSERQILDLASLLVKWGYICRHVCPRKVQKGPIVLCLDCERIVVEEERD